MRWPKLQVIKAIAGKNRGPSYNTGYPRQLRLFATCFESWV
jgi:hypothetical protein